jgi:hypothetical protein
LGETQSAFICVHQRLQPLTTLLENPVPIYAVGAVLATLCGLVFLARRNLPSLFAFVGVVAVTLLLVVVERLVVTDREQVESAVVELMLAIERNDLPAVLATIDPAATEIRSDAETLMSQVRVDDTGASSLRVEVDTATSTPTAVAKFRGKIDAIHKRSGQRAFYFDKVHLYWTKRDDKWLVSDYQAHVKGVPINAVDGLPKVRTIR